MNLVDVADELYAQPAEDFTAARDAAAKQARADDRELAAAIGKLKRPTASAWLVDQLARRHPDRLEELLALGDELREAQDAMAGDDLRRLNRERHQLVHAVAELVREFGPPVTDAVAREVEATLDAALSDTAAGDAVRTGRLVRALTAGGFDGVDLGGAVAVPDAEPAPRATRSTSTAPAARQRSAPAAKKPSGTATKPAAAAKKSAAEAARDAAARRKAAHERTRARNEQKRLQRELDQQDATVTRAREQVATARNRIAELETELAAARSTRADAERELDDAQRRRTATARAHRDAVRAAEKAG
jgi:chromosome segregation ATPase